MKIKSEKILSPASIRSLCIEQNWYTCGTNEEYNNMLNMIQNKRVTKNLLYRIALDIYYHSKKETYCYSCNEQIEHIMFYLNKAVNEFFTIIEE